MNLSLFFGTQCSHLFLNGRFGDFAASHALGANPDAVNMPVGLGYFEVLQIRLEPALRFASDLNADTALPLGHTAGDVFSARDWSFIAIMATTRHD
jgi:hypothetical protein